MLKKALIVLVHFLTNLTIQISILIYAVFFYDYTVNTLIISFFAGIAILCFDFFVCKNMNANYLIIKKPGLLHCADLILAIPPCVFLLYIFFIDLKNGTAEWANYSAYDFVLGAGTLIIETILVLERINLFRQ